jgi:hypothetical protein
VSDDKTEGPGRKAPGPLEPDREIVFYYNRERRLEKASAEVRAINEGTPLIQGGLIRSLTSTKPHLLLFITILVILAGIMVFSAMSGPGGGGVMLVGNTLRVSAGRGGKPFLLVKKTITNDEDAPYTGAVYVGVSPLFRSSENIDPADIPVFTDLLFFTLEKEEEYRLDLPFSAETYLLLFQAGDQRVSTRVSGK